VSIPPSCIKLFDAVGVTPAIERAAFVRSTGNTVWWGSDEPRAEQFQSGARGWQADLHHLSEVMRAEVSSDVVQVWSTPADAGMLDADVFVLDCTGRAGVIARDRNVREYDGGPKTVALAGEWQTRASWAVPDDTHTVIESYRDGWMWSVPVAPGVRHVSAMVDPQRSDLARGGASRDVYLGEIGKTRQFRRLLADAALSGGPWGWDATPYRSREYAGDNWLLVGDAASFIDPLSSAGVKKALASAWLAAVVAHTCVQTPAMRPHALAFFAAREREIERTHAAAARLFLSEAAGGHREPFWTDRTADVAPSPDDQGGARAAFQLLKESKEFRMRPSPALTVADRPFVDGHAIRLGPHVVIGAGDAGTRYLHNVDMPALIEIVPEVNEVPELFNAYVARHGRVDLHDFLLALSSAVARGWLVSQ
jgi:hypothetical protein